MLYVTKLMTSSHRQSISRFDSMKQENVQLLKSSAVFRPEACRPPARHRRRRHLISNVKQFANHPAACFYVAKLNVYGSGCKLQIVKYLKGCGA